MPTSEELNELAQAAVRKMMPNNERVIVTKGVLVIEVLIGDNAGRSVLGVEFGAQGDVPPHEILGLLAPVRIRAEQMIWAGLDERQ